MHDMMDQLYNHNPLCPGGTTDTGGRNRGGTPIRITMNNTYIYVLVRRRDSVSMSMILCGVMNPRRDCNRSCSQLLQVKELCGM